MVARITIDASVIAKGSPEALALRKAIQGIKTDIDGVTKINTEYVEAGKRTAMSNRTLLFNFRMLSFAVRTLRREFGVTNPLVENLSRTMIIGAAVGSLYVSTNDLITRGLPALAGEAAKGKVGLDALTAGMLAGKLAVTGLAVAIGVLLGIVAGTWFGEWIGGFRPLNQEIKAYKNQVEDLTNSLAALNVEQTALSAESSMYAAALAKVNYEIELQGYATDAQIETKKMLNNEIGRTRMESAGVRAETAMLTADTAKATFEEKQLRDEKKAAVKDIFDPTHMTDKFGIGSKVGGIINEAARGNVGGTGGPMRVLIDFTNAKFGNARDIEGAVSRGVLEGVNSVGRTLEFLRRGGG